MAGAQQVVRLLLPQRDRAADVGADLGVARGCRRRPSSRGPSRAVMSSGCIRTRITAALALAWRSSVPSIGRSPSAFSSKKTCRLGVDQLADLHVRGLDRGAVDVVDDAHALLPDGVRELVARQRAEVAQGDDRGQAEEGHRPEQRVAHQRPAPDAGVLDSPARAPRRPPRGPPRRRSGVAVLDDLVVAHQLARPVDRADADAEQGQAEGGAERDVGGAEAEEGVGVSTDLEDEVGHAEEHGEHGGEAEQGGHLALGAPSRPRGRRRSGGGGARAGPGPQVGSESRTVELVLVAHAASPFGCFLTRAVLEVIQIADTDQAPMPTSQANTPSETGPREPSVNPP